MTVQAKLRVALILSGHLRGWRYCLPQLQKYVLSAYRPDIFMHTWDVSEVMQKHASHSGKIANRLWDTESVNKEKMIQAYQPTALLIENQESLQLNKKHDFESFKLRYRFNPYGAFCQAYTRYHADKLRQEYQAANNVKYDLVISTRADIYVRPTLPLPTDKIQANTSYHVSSGKLRPWADNSHHFYRMMDTFFYAAPETMSCITDYYQQFSLAQECSAPEEHFMRHLMSAGITPEYITHRADGRLTRKCTLAIIDQHPGLRHRLRRTMMQKYKQ